MNTKQLETFISVAKCGSFSKAEAGLYLSRQAIMKQIDQLEKELGFTLFERCPAGVSLTPSGQQFYEGIVPLQADFLSLTDRCRAAGRENSLIRIEIPKHPRTLLDAVIARFSALYPDVQVEISLSPSKSRIARVQAGKVDIAEMPYSPAVREAGLEYVHLSDNPYMCLMSKRHPLAYRTVIEPECLPAYPIYVTNLQSRQALIRYLQDLVPGILFHEIPGDELEGVLNVCYNNGIYISPAYYASHLEPLASVPLRCSLTREIGMICRPDPGRLTKRFVQTAKEIYPG